MPVVQSPQLSPYPTSLVDLSQTPGGYRYAGSSLDYRGDKAMAALPVGLKRLGSFNDQKRIKPCSTCPHKINRRLADSVFLQRRGAGGWSLGL